MLELLENSMETAFPPILTPFKCYTILSLNNSVTQFDALLNVADFQAYYSSIILLSSGVLTGFCFIIYQVIYERDFSLKIKAYKHFLNDIQHINDTISNPDKFFNCVDDKINIFELNENVPKLNLSSFIDNFKNKLTMSDNLNRKFEHIDEIEKIKSLGLKIGRIGYYSTDGKASKRSSIQSTIASDNSID